MPLYLAKSMDGFQKYYTIMGSTSQHCRHEASTLYQCSLLQPSVNDMRECVPGEGTGNRQQGTVTTVRSDESLVAEVVAAAFPVPKGPPTPSIGVCRPVRRGSADPFGGGLPTRSTGVCRPVRRGSADPFSLKTLHWRVFRALEPLKTLHWRVFRALEPLKLSTGLFSGRSMSLFLHTPIHSRSHHILSTTLSIRKRSKGVGRSSATRGPSPVKVITQGASWA